jgi:NitT/TauT family transport system ATP-binding protein
MTVHATGGGGAAAVRPGTAGAVVEARGIGKTFGTDAGAVTALESIDLAVRDGEFVSLIGPSGCGKSTLLRIIADLTAPTAGEILVYGKPARQARLDRDYGMVFQAPVLMDWRTVSRNIELPLEIMGFPRAERARRSAALLKLVELEGFDGKRPWQLSGGMQQRVAIARALAFDPKLLLMDEPFGALDEMTRERMNLELMRIWRETGTTVVFVTHSIPEAVFLSSRVIVMSPRPGRISRIVDIDLPQPRTFETRELPRYFALVTEVREALRKNLSGDEAEPIGGGPTSGSGDPQADTDGTNGPTDPAAERVRAEGYA